MKDEIQAGLKNAIERGSSLEEAVQSFIAAGYNPVEVKEAANSINSGATSVITPKRDAIPVPSPSQQPMQMQQQEPQSFQSDSSSLSDLNSHELLQQAQPISQQAKPLEIQEKSKKQKVTAMIVIILILLVAGLLALFFNKQILDLFKGAF